MNVENRISITENWNIWPKLFNIFDMHKKAWQLFSVSDKYRIRKMQSLPFKGQLISKRHFEINWPLAIKWFKNWFYQKMLITKNVLLNWYSSMKKIRMIFDSSLLNQNSEFKTQNSIIFFRYVNSEAILFLIFYPPFENPTTRIAIRVG